MSWGNYFRGSSNQDLRSVEQLFAPIVSSEEAQVCLFVVESVGLDRDSSGFRELLLDPRSIVSMIDCKRMSFIFFAMLGLVPMCAW